MTEDIWGEKPKGFTVTSIEGERLYLAGNMDDWLEKMRSSFDESIADCHHSLEVVAKKLGAYMEKAESWNELCEGLEYGGDTPVRDILQEINLIDRDNELRRKKLEAIKTWHDGLTKESWKLVKYSYCGLCDELKKILDG